jgi:polysaccharide biosynthesis protein PslH
VSSARRVLVVTPFVPSRQADHGGGRIVAESLLHLATRHRVALLTLRGVDEPAVGEELRSALDHVEEVERVSIGLSPRRLAAERGRVLAMLRREPPWVVGCEVAAARRSLRSLASDWQPDVVQLEFLAMARYATALERPRPPIVLVHYDAAPDGQEGPTPAWARHAGRSLARVDALVVLSEHDRALVSQLAPSPVRVIRPGLDLPPRADQDGVGGVLFVGSFSHAPNVEAARRLVEVIHPLVRARYPDATLTIVGADPPPDLSRGVGVRITGRVPDVRPYVERAAVVVAPLAFGAGVRIKVLDALARGKALVATNRAIAGLELRDGEHALIRDDDREFADAVAELLEDPQARTRLGDAARAWAEGNLSWDVALDRYDRLYEELTRR